MNARYQRLLAAGFRPKAADALARAGFDVIEWVPFGWVGHDPFVPLKCRGQVAR
jgi:hypothetical protein